MKKIILLFLALLSAVTCMAAEGTPLSAFHGHWRGQGLYKKQTGIESCPIFELGFQVENNILRFETGRRVCGGQEEKFQPLEVINEGGIIKWEGQVVGAFRDGLFTVEFATVSESGKKNYYRMSMRSEGNTLLYEESLKVEGNESPQLSFTGITDKSTD